MARRSPAATERAAADPVPRTSLARWLCTVAHARASRNRRGPEAGRRGGGDSHRRPRTVAAPAAAGPDPIAELGHQRASGRPALRARRAGRSGATAEPKGERIVARPLRERPLVSGLVMAAGMRFMVWWDLEASGHLARAQTVALTTDSALPDAPRRQLPVRAAVGAQTGRRHDPGRGRDRDRQAAPPRAGSPAGTTVSVVFRVAPAAGS